MPDLKPGSYKLAQDVKNPNPDRRHRHNWKKREVWEKGTVLVVSDDGPAPDPGLPVVQVLVISRPSKFDHILLKSEVGQLLAAQLVPMAERPSDWLKREHSLGSAPSILDYLVRTGRLTDEEVKAAYVASCADDSEG